MYRKCFDIIASKLDESSTFRLGLKLNLSHKDVDEICNRNIRIYEKIYQILTLWQEQSGQQANLNQIIIILHDMNEHSIADKIAAKLDSSQ